VLAAALTAQGKTQGLYSVFATPEDAFLLVCDGGVRQALFAALGKFIVADRVSLEDVSSGWILVHAIVSEEEARSIAHERAGQQIYMRASRRLGEPGFDLLLPTSSAQESLAMITAKLGSPITPFEYELQRLQRGQPVFPDEVNEGIILTECGMRDAVSFSKGCYVGQEVIERSDAIGKLPRTLERIVLEGVLAAQGASVTNARGELIGKLVSAIVDEKSGATYGFAMLRTGVYSENEPISCDGIQGYVKKV